MGKRNKKVSQFYAKSATQTYEIKKLLAYNCISAEKTFHKNKY